MLLHVHDPSMGVSDIRIHYKSMGVSETLLELQEPAGGGVADAASINSKRRL